jgi:hypothetical protein
MFYQGWQKAKFLQKSVFGDKTAENEVLNFSAAEDINKLQIGPSGIAEIHSIHKQKKQNRKKETGFANLLRLDLQPAKCQFQA